ncbi:hypothetical protein VHEMI08440 [[Torrubiella] hemipterigena]|uniref:Lipase, secreted n=1 Tax=[Torrubiella] hemipterigena TaxID=1531966 RepID=A0A0A1TN75_9HYPO|nr:hypothetical protein VHEMI08440 [[Torrubiella] hemipterigena]
MRFFAALSQVTLLFVTVVPSVNSLVVDQPPQLFARDDSFFDPPAGFESQPPGSVLRSRKIIASFFTFIPDPIEAYQILYRTTAVNGSAIATATTIFKPLFAKKDRFVTYNIAYDSSGVQCSPSRAFPLGSNPTTALAAGELLLIQIYLLSGYIVSSPDYEGPDAAFTPGYLSGMGVLDSMRAVANFADTLGLSQNPMSVGVGYSGGGLATGWAAAMQPAYAPELAVKGWVAGGVPANLTSIFEYIDGTVVSGFEPIAIAGMLKPTAHGALLQPLFHRIATPLGKHAIEVASSQCAAAPLIEFAFQSVLDTKFQSLGRELLTDPTIGPLITRNTLGVNQTETPAVPVLMYHAQPDEIVPYPAAATLRSAWCDYGATIKFTTFAAGGHGTTALLGIPDALQFVNDAFSDNVAPGCTTKTLLNDQLSPLALGLNLEPLAVGLINAIAALGKKDANWLNGIKDGKSI